MYESRTQRLRDTRLDLERFMVRRREHGYGPPVDVGPQMMRLPDIAEYMGCSGDTIRSDVRRINGVKLNDRLIYYHVRDVAAWLVQKEVQIK